MQFLFDGNFYKAIKITGPAHNMLGLKLSKNKVNDIEIIALTKIGEKNNINSGDVMNQVMSGIEKVNQDLGVTFTVEKIQFIPSDTPSESVYEELTIEIIKQLIAGNFIM